MKLPAHTSASSLTSFVDCPARWTLTYDQDRKIRSSNDASEAGTLVHGALERWHNPLANHPRTYEALLSCYYRGAQAEGIGESFDVFKRGLSLLKSAYRLDTTHPTLPMQFSRTISTEAEIKDWQMEGWALPVRGFIDRIHVVTPSAERPNEIVLVIEDYKTGKMKTWSELTESDIQPPLYCLWAVDVLVPHLESLGYSVLRVALTWTYIAHDDAVQMYSSDFDLDVLREYIGSLTHQIVNFVEAYNAVEGDPERLRVFLSKNERPNHYCSYCPRKNVCSAFTNLLDQKATIDLTNPATQWTDIFALRERYAAAKKWGDEGQKNIDDLFRAYLDQNRLENLEVGDKVYKADQQQSKEYLVKDVAEVLGVDFILQHAKITQDNVNKQIALIATSDSDAANEMRQTLEARMRRSPGPRIVRGSASGTKTRTRKKT